MPAMSIAALHQKIAIKQCSALVALKSWASIKISSTMAAQNLFFRKMYLGY
jgi:hypothetical protein